MTDKLPYDEANALAEKFEKFRNSETFGEMTGQITRLAASKALFEYAENYMKREENENEKKNHSSSHHNDFAMLCRVRGTRNFR